MGGGGGALSVLCLCTTRSCSIAACSSCIVRPNTIWPCIDGQRGDKSYLDTQAVFGTGPYTRIYSQGQIFRDNFGIFGIRYLEEMRLYCS